MVYSAIETTCFGLYWPSSGFYNIKEGSIKTVKTVKGVLIRRSLHQSPDHFVPNARAICKDGELYKQRKILGGVELVKFKMFRLHVRTKCRISGHLLLVIINLNTE